MPWTTLCLLAAALGGAGLAADAQVPLTLPPPTATPQSLGKTGAGISGPGKPITNDTWATPGAGAHKSNGSAVTQGLIPAIQPVWNLHLRDTVMCVGGDGNYYMTGSSGDNIWSFNDGVELWRSPDLKTWTYVGLVWSVAKDGTYEKQWRDLHSVPARAVWAPEIHYLKSKKNYFICLSMAPGGITLLKSATGKPEGPYVNVTKDGKPLRGGIDATLFEDTDGKVYFTNGSASRISLMKDDMTGFAETRDVVLENPDHTPSHHAAKDVARGMNDLGNEGAVMFKANGRYYLGAADTYESRYSSCVAQSGSVWGPYRNRQETVPTGGGTGYFEDKQGRWWCTYFGNDTQAPWREMPGIVQVTFATDGTIQVAKTQPAFVLRPKARK